MHKNILVTGSKGQLGNELQVLSQKNDNNFLFTDIDELDITDISSLKKFLVEHKISNVINCAAYTAVDKAESEERIAYKINASAVKNLAILSSELNYDLVHISTDFVFDGTKSTPYIEKDKTNPLSVYGKTKLEGEKEILKNTDKAVIIRTSWLYSSFGNNFVKTIIRLCKERESLNVIYDQIGTPTYANDLAMTILHILENGEFSKNEVFHFSNEGVASWYDFASIIKDHIDSSCNIRPIETKDYLTPAIRPHYSVLNKAKIKNCFNFEIPYWQDSLKKCISLLEY